MHILAPHIILFDHSATQKQFYAAQIASAYSHFPHTLLPYPEDTTSLERMLQICVDDVYCRTILAVGKVFTANKFQKALKKVIPNIDTPPASSSFFAVHGLSYMRLNHDTHLLISSGSEASLIAAAKILSTYNDIIDGKSLYHCAKKLGDLLKANSLTIASAESCSGGLIVKTLTDIPGSSSYVCGGSCTYTAFAKSKILGVMPDTLSTYGIVSAETANAMAKGAQQLYECDIALATTGVAGPGADTDGNPEGLVYVSVAHGDKCTAYKYTASTHTPLLDRDSIRKGCTLFALDTLYTTLLNQDTL